MAKSKISLKAWTLKLKIPSQFGAKINIYTESAAPWR